MNINQSKGRPISVQFFTSISYLTSTILCSVLAYYTYYYSYKHGASISLCYGSWISCSPISAMIFRLSQQQMAKEWWINFNSLCLARSLFYIRYILNLDISPFQPVTMISCAPFSFILKLSFSAVKPSTILYRIFTTTFLGFPSYICAKIRHSQSAMMALRYRRRYMGSCRSLQIWTILHIQVAYSSTYLPGSQLHPGEMNLVWQLFSSFIQLIGTQVGSTIMNLKLRVYSLSKMALMPFQMRDYSRIRQGSWDWQYWYQLGQMDSTIKRLRLACFNSDQQCRTMQSQSSFCFKIYLKWWMQQRCSLNTLYQCRVWQFQTVSCMRDNSRSLIDFEQTFSATLAASSLRRSQMISTILFTTRAFSYFYCEDAVLRRDRYPPSCRIKARIYVTLQKRCSNLPSSCLLPLSIFIFLRPKPNEMMNLSKMGRRLLQNSPASSSTLKYMASSFSNTLISSKIFMQSVS